MRYDTVKKKGTIQLKSKRNSHLRGEKIQSKVRFDRRRYKGEDVQNLGWSIAGIGS